MENNLPLTIENGVGQKLTFIRMEPSPVGDKVMTYGVCNPGKGPAMHTHLQQDESLTVVSGKMGYQILGRECNYLNPGETVQFNRGTPHRFWAAGQKELHVAGWVIPVHSIIFFLSSLYDAQKKSGKERPEIFDGAYLVTRYKTEYDLPELPKFVKKIVFPIIYWVGKITGRYRHFNNAPVPLK